MTAAGGFFDDDALDKMRRRVQAQGHVFSPARDGRVTCERCGWIATLDDVHALPPCTAEQ